MKFLDIYNLRKSYTKSTIDLLNKSFHQKKFSSIEKEIKKMLDNDWKIQSDLSIINTKLKLLNRSIDSLSNKKNTIYKKNTLTKILKIKFLVQNDRQQKIKLQKEYNSYLINNYSTIIDGICKIMHKEIIKNELYQKIDLIISKSDTKYIAYCNNWKSDKIFEHKKIAHSTEIVIRSCINIIKKINVDFTLHNIELHNHNRRLRKQNNNKLIYSCETLIKHITYFINTYPHIAHYNNDMLLSLSIDKISLTSSFKTGTITEEHILNLIEEIKVIQQYFYKIFEVNRAFLIKLELEKFKINKIAKTKKTIFKEIVEDWLFQDHNSIYYVFSEYIKNK